MLEPLFSDSRLTSLGLENVPMSVEMDFEKIFGYLLSPSRIRAQLDQRETEEHGAFLSSTREEMKRVFPEGAHLMKMRLEAAGFQLS